MTNTTTGHPRVDGPGRRERSVMLQRLDALHADYVERINHANAEGRDDQVRELAAAYDDESTRMVAEREGLTDLLPLVTRPETAQLRGINRLRRLTQFDPFGAARRRAS